VSAQGWDHADHRCGRCGHTFTATTQADFVTQYGTHDLAHALAEALATLAPELLAQLARLLSDRQT
jgi:hypothetical protein